MFRAKTVLINRLYV